MIRGIRISGLLFVMVRMLLVLNVTPGTWGAEWEESNKSLPLVVMWHKCIMVMFLYLIAVSDHNTTMTAGLLQMGGGLIILIRQQQWKASMRWSSGVVARVVLIALHCIRSEVELAIKNGVKCLPYGPVLHFALLCMLPCLIWRLLAVRFESCRATEYLVGDDPVCILRVVEVEPVPADAAVADGARLPGPVVSGSLKPCALCGCRRRTRQLHRSTIGRVGWGFRSSSILLQMLILNGFKPLTQHAVIPNFN